MVPTRIDRASGELDPARIIPFLLLGSGACALVYQIAWTRELRLIFGASTAASAAVLAIFIGGLGLGAHLLGRRAERAARPLALYALLELGITLSAAATLPLLWLTRSAYLALGGSFALGAFGGTALRLFLSALVLGVPTVLMGGTLPAAARAMTTQDDPERRRLSLLYGLNTLGGVAGTAIATFWMLELFGTRRTLLVATVANLAVAIGAYLLSRKLAPLSTTATDSKPEALPPPRFVLAVAAVSGFAFFLLEIAWYRLLGPLLGGSVYTFGLILALALAGIGIGAVLRSVATPRTGTGSGLGSLARISAAEALAIAVPLAAGDRIAVLALYVRPAGDGSFGAFLLGWILVAGLVILPAAIFSGIQFPLLVSLLGRGTNGVASDTGRVYGWNTLGAIAGSVAGGFGLLPLLGAVGCWRLAAVAMLAIAIAAAVVGVRDRREGLLLAGLALPAMLCAAAPGPGAPWRHGAIGTGRVAYPSNRNELEDWMRTERRGVRWETDGVESSIALTQGEGYAFAVNGKIDGNCISDAGTQVMSGLVGALLHPAPKRSMVIGLGSGSTAGWLGAVPGMERVDVVELEPAVLQVARDCSLVNQGVLENPLVHIAIGDAREALLTSRETWDVIFSEPSNPYRAGIASLFTAEFYRGVDRRLSPGGIFVQWLQAYEVDRITVATVITTLHSVFPEISIWQTSSGDLILVATRDAVPLDVARLARAVETEPWREGLAVSWHVAGVEGFLSRHLANPELARRIAERNQGILNTDDRTSIEFGFARGIAGRRDQVVAGLDGLSRTLGTVRPAISGDIDWTRVEVMRTGIAVLNAGTIAEAPAIEQPRAAAAAYSLYQQRRFDAAVTAFGHAAPGREPAGIAEITLVATGLAERGDDSAAAVAERLREDHPGIADAILTRLRWRQGRREEAVALAEKTLQSFRTNPWIPTVPGTHFLELVAEMSSGDSEIAAKMLTATEPPFALHAIDEMRLAIRFSIASTQLDPATCAAVVAPLEPDVPWRQSALEFRRDCYLATKSPLAADAQRDVVTFNRRAR